MARAREQLLARERLGEEVDGAAELLARELLVEVPRHEEDREVRPLRAELVAQLLAGAAGHHQVGEQEVDLLDLSPDDGERVALAARLQDAIAGLLQRPARGLADGALGLDDE